MPWTYIGAMTIAVAVALLPLIPVSEARQDDNAIREVVDGFKALHGFDDLPGKAAPKRAGLAFHKEDYPAFTKLTIQENSVRAIGERGAFRKVVLAGGTNASATIELEIVVAMVGNNDAQSWIFQDAALRPSLRAFTRGDEKLDVRIGDFNYFYLPKEEVRLDKPEEIRGVAFSRSNVSVILTKVGDFQEKINLLSVSEKMDKLVQEAPLLSERQGASLLPEITEFRLDTNDPAVSKDSRTPVILGMRDKNDKPHELHAEFSRHKEGMVSRGNPTTRKKGQGFEFAATETGTIQLRVFVINSRNLLGTRATAVTIQE